MPPAPPTQENKNATGRIDDMTVVITGATAGVGRATARAFAQRGATVALLARGEDGLEAAAKDVETAGGRAEAIVCDVSDADAVEQAADRAEHVLGPIDVWVNNAMVSVFAPVADLTAEEIRRVTAVTYLGHVHGTLAALARMRARNRGTIVQVSSALAHRAIPLQAAYCGAKHAIKGFSESLRCELLHDHSGVRVTRVDLPAINTPQFDWVRNRLPGRPRPAGRIYQPEVAADAIVWASERAPRELHVGITTAAVLAANRVAPGLLDRYLATVAWDGQQTDEPADPDAPDNLFDALPGARDAHGRFDAEAHTTSWLLAARTALGHGGQRRASPRQHAPAASGERVKHLSSERQFR
jgi:short-subunit dehydrogenase